MRNQEFNIIDFGAQADTVQLQTVAIQACIEACREAGGGQITVPTGRFLIGSLRLYSDMTLYLQAGAQLIGSPNYLDYDDFQVPTTIMYANDAYYQTKWHLPPYYFYGLITAFQAENISIIGEPGAVIDGCDTYDANGEEQFRGPMGIVMSQVKHLQLIGYTMQNSANWSHCLDGCEQVLIERVTVQAGHDGFNLHHSRAIKVQNCHLETGDDCFAGYDIRQLQVTNCQLNTACNVFRVGGHQLVVDNCQIKGPGRYPHLSQDTYNTHALFKYYSIDVDQMTPVQQDITFQDCLIDNIGQLIVYDFGNRNFMQTNRPLDQINFKRTTINHLTQSSTVNGQHLTVSFEKTLIDFNSKQPFLTFKTPITLKLNEVTFKRPTTIMLANGQQLTLDSQINLIVTK